VSSTGIDTTELFAVVPPLVLDPAVPTTLYTARERVYRSTDAAVSWTPISASFASGNPTSLFSRGVVNALAVSPVDGQVLWAGTDEGRVRVSDDGGMIWDPADPPGPLYWISDIAPDPFDREGAYVAVAGFRAGDPMPYIQRTDDLGQTWDDVSDGGLAQLPINTVLADVSWRGRVFAGSDLGVYVSDDAGASWALLGDGLPHAPVMDLEYNETSMQLFAATHGRSVWTFDVTQLGPADGDGDGVDNNADCALADGGAFAPPGEVTQLDVQRLSGGEAQLFWTDLAPAAGAGTVYDVAASSLAGLAAAGSITGSLACGVAATTLIDDGIPQPGEGMAYIVRGRNTCAAGSWGTDGGGMERPGPACP
jgi:hypothetical protein